jgi:fluoroquinolone transport system ATP-binding protein
MIRVKDLNYTYPSTSQPALRRLAFDIQPGEIFGFLGPSGAGKSTTQKILIGLLRDYQGSIEVMGRELSQWGSEYYEQVGVSFEFPNHFLKLSALENLTYFSRLYRGKTHDPRLLLGWVGLEEDSHLLVSQFSKGMKNRLSVARALLHDPQIIFLDEPTSGLDPVNARGMKDLILAQRAAGKTVFLTTHDMTIADELCSRVALIVDGEIRQVGTPRDLKLQHGRSSLRISYANGKRLEHREFGLQGLADNAEFLSVLRTGQVQTLHSQEASLEDVILQFRNGFYYAVLFVLALWVGVLSLARNLDFGVIIPIMVLMNLVVGTFYFMAAMLLLEKGEGTLEAQIVSPLRAREYLLSKVISLALLALLENVLIVLALRGLQFNLWPLAAGLLLAAALYTLFGFLTAARYDSINGYFFPSIGWLLLLSLPILRSLGIVDHWSMYLHPLQAPLTLLQAAIQPLAAWQWVYGVGYSLVWLGLVVFWSGRTYSRFVVLKAGVIA